MSQPLWVFGRNSSAEIEPLCGTHGNSFSPEVERLKRIVHKALVAPRGSWRACRVSVRLTASAQEGPQFGGDKAGQVRAKIGEEMLGEVRLGAGIAGRVFGKELVTGVGEEKPLLKTHKKVIVNDAGLD
jgi:hypothetical protein